MSPGGVRIEHRVIDNQLAASLEDVAERLRPTLALEGVLLFDELPRQIAPLPAQLVTHPAELLLLRQVPLPCREPLVVFHHLVSCHVISPPQALATLRARALATIINRAVKAGVLTFTFRNRPSPKSHPPRLTTVGAIGDLTSAGEILNSGSPPPSFTVEGARFARRSP